MKRQIFGVKTKLNGLLAVLITALLLTACGAEATPIGSTGQTASPVPATTAVAAGPSQPAASAAATSAGSAATATPGSTPAATTAATRGGAATNSAQAKTELVIADGLKQNEAVLLKEQVAAFQKANPNLKLTSVHYNLEELNELVKSGAGSNPAFDLMIAPANYVSDWTESKALQPAGKLFEPSFLSNYVPNSLGASNQAGQQWGVPYTYGGVPVLLYNRVLIPEAPATTAEMVSLAKKLTEKNDNKKDRDYGLALDINQPGWFVAWLGGFGGKVLDSNNKPALNTPEMVNTLQFYHDLAYKDKVATPTFEFGMNQLDYAFRDGRLGMMVAGDWAISNFGGVQPQKKAAAGSPAATPGQGNIEATPGAGDYAEKFGLAVAPLPKISSTGKYPTPFINNQTIFVGVGVGGEKLKAARTLIEFLAGPEQQAAMLNQGLLPTTQAALNSPAVKNNPILSGLAKQLEVAVPEPPAYELQAVWEAILPNLQGVSADVLKPQEAAKKMQDAAEESLRSLARSRP